MKTLLVHLANVKTRAVTINYLEFVLVFLGLFLQAENITLDLQRTLLRQVVQHPKLIRRLLQLLLHLQNREQNNR